MTTPFFDPEEFLRLGSGLALHGTTEAMWRSAIGRLYYAVHLKARETLAASGWPLPTENVHAAVIDELINRRHLQVNLVRSLKRLRIDADYTLDATIEQEHARRARILALRVFPNI